MPSAPQNYQNHARFVPGFHFVLFAMLLAVFFWQVYILAKRPGVPAAMGVILIFSLFMLAWYARRFAVTVQDRIIRLEETLRMQRLLPAAGQSRIAEFTSEQLVALRFASDAELPVLAKRVLDEQIADQKEIKKLVKEWRADHLRA